MSSARPGMGMSKLLVGLIALLLAGCGGLFGTTSDYGVPATLSAKRYPVVAVTAGGSRAAIVSSGRENEDSQRPVQKFGHAYRFDDAALTPPQSLAGATAQTFIASGRPDLSGRNDLLAIDASGIATAVWSASNAGTLELYASQFSVIDGGWGPRQLLATSSSGFSTQRVSMDGFGRTLVAWSESDGLIHTRAFLPAQGWLAPSVIPAQFAALGDVAMRRNQGHAVWTGNGEVWLATMDNYIWSAPVRIGSGAIGAPRLATHRDAVDGSLVAVWAQADGLYINRLTANGPEFADGQKIPGSDGGRNPQVVMGANEETTVVWGGMANRAVNRVWGTAQAIDSGPNPRLAGDALGNAVLVHGETQVHATRFVRGSGWLPREQIGGSMVPGGAADVAMDDQGRALVVWEEEIAATPDPLDTHIATAVIGAPSARFSVQSGVPTAGVPVVFDASASSDSGGSIVDYQWDYTGDGRVDAISSSPLLNHLFTQAGSYPVRLTVTDNSGLASSSTQVIVVGANAAYGVNLLVNPGFESDVLNGLLPTAPGNWRGDRSDSVAAEQGIAPRSDTRMLKFVATADVPSSNNLTSQQWQIVDLTPYRSDIDAGRVRADASAWFNRVAGTAFTDRRFDIRLQAFSGDPSQLPASYVNPSGVRLAELTASLDSGGNTWQQAALQLQLPPGTTYVLVEIYAYEDVRNDAALPEFDGHYADDTALVLTFN